MNKKLVFFLSILLVAEASTNEVRHLQLNGAHMVDTSPTNYALAAPNLLQNQWKTFSLNGNNVLIVAPNCQQILKTADSLTSAERQAVEGARANLLAIESGQQVSNGAQPLRYGVTRYSLQPGSSSTHSINLMNVQFSSFNSNGMSITKTDDKNFSASKLGMPNNLARIFVNDDITTYVYLNGQVQMKPTDCLQPAEVQMNQQIREEAQQAQQQMNANMQRMQQNMQNMQQNIQNNIQQSMQNLHQNMMGLQQNMQNMFGNGFPFNNMMGGGNMMMGGNQMVGYGLQQQQQQPFNNMQSGFSLSRFNPFSNGFFSMGGNPNGRGYAAASAGVFPFGG